MKTPIVQQVNHTNLQVAQTLARNATGGMAVPGGSLTFEDTAHAGPAILGSPVSFAAHHPFTA